MGLPTNKTAPSWGGCGTLGLVYTHLYLLGHCSYNAGGWKDRAGVVTKLIRGKLAQQCIRLGILGPQVAGKHEVEVT